MRSERIEIDDVMALYVGLHSPMMMKKYLEARQKAIMHNVPQANLVLGRTYGVLLWLEQLEELCILAGMTRRDAKLFRQYRFLNDYSRERMKTKFIDGIMRLGNTREDAYILYEFIAYSACDTWKRTGVAEHVRQFVKVQNSMMP